MRYYVRLCIMYDPERNRWEAWDNSIRPRILGLGSTPAEALFELTETLTRLGIDAPEWIRPEVEQ